jgi:hypothetical protein
MLRILKDGKRLVSNFDKVLKISSGYVRLIIFVLVNCLIMHILTCVWILIGRTFDDKNWINEKTDFVIAHNESFEDSYILYLFSLYFIITTITTIGYGDITPVNVLERCFCFFLMFLGAAMYSFMSGQMSSILSNYDSKQAKQSQKFHLLNRVVKKYKISP